MVTEGLEVWLITGQLSSDGERRRGQRAGKERIQKER